MWKVKMLCKFSKLEIWYQLPVCCSTFGCERRMWCELLPHIVLTTRTLSPVAPGRSIRRSLCRQALKRLIIYYRQGWHIRYHNGSVCFTHYLRSFVCNQVIKCNNKKKRKEKINKWTEWTSMMLAGPLFHHPDQIKIPSSMALQMCVLVFSRCPWERTAQRSWAFSQSVLT